MEEMPMPEDGISFEFSEFYEFSEWAGKAVADYAYAPLASLIGVDVEEAGAGGRRSHIPTPRSSTHTPRTDSISISSSPDTTHRGDAALVREAHLKDQKTPTPKMLRELRARELSQHEATLRKFQELDGTCI
jgi:hypothetical protein